MLENNIVQSKNEISSFIQEEEFLSVKNMEQYQKLGISKQKTYPRLKNVICGYTTDRGKIIDPKPANLKYYKTDYIEKTSTDEFYSVGEELLKHIKEMIQLEHGISVDNEQYFLLLSDDEADELEKMPEKLLNCKGIYISSAVFLTKSQEKLFEDIAITTVPDYYFEEELREVGEL